MSYEEWKKAESVRRKLESRDGGLRFNFIMQLQSEKNENGFQIEIRSNEDF